MEPTPQKEKGNFLEVPARYPGRETQQGMLTKLRLKIATFFNLLTAYNLYYEIVSLAYRQKNVCSLVRT